jgi:hypothetical protein
LQIVDFGFRIADFEKSRQLADCSGQKDNAHCAFINYHLAFYLNVSISVICEFSMINANLEMRDAK